MPRNMDSFDPNDLALPELKLVQNTGGEDAKRAGAKPGDLYLTLTDEVIPQEKGLEIIIVDFGKVRTYWGRTDISNDPPSCSSTNGNESVDGQNCNECEKRCDTPWLLSADARRDKCLLSYTIMALNGQDCTPLFVRAGGISSKAAKELYTMLKLNRSLKGEYHRATVKVSSEKKITAFGTSYALKFGPPKLVTDSKLIESYKQTTESILGSNLLETGTSEPEAYTADGEPIYKGDSRLRESETAKTVQAQNEEADKPAKIDLNF